MAQKSIGLTKLLNDFKQKSMLEIQLIDSDIKVPTKAHKGDAGWDLYTKELKTLHMGEIYAFPLGFRIIGKPGMMYKVEDKSGLAIKGLHCMGGVIDNNYRGECHAIVQNMNMHPIDINVHTKIAQLVVQYVSDDDHLIINTSEVVEETSRGSSGFGSTGLT
jgi:dUTP pyrophosphatase